MTSEPTLHGFLSDSASRLPDKTAVVDPGRASLTYREMDQLSDRLRDRLMHMGVRPGDRVGIYLRKSVDAITSIFGILKCGAAYIPVDPDAPPARCAYILNNCSVAAFITHRSLESALSAELVTLGVGPPSLLLDDQGNHPVPLRAALAREDENGAAPAADTVQLGEDSLAYILYTSGSTGRPKGVMLSHRNAVSFVDWCSSVLSPSEVDVFSSHAPLHFDLSILDVFSSVKHGSSLILIGEALGKDPRRLAPVIADMQISVWYSTPSILSLLAQYGKLDRYQYPALRAVLFAGEVFPVSQLRAVRALWPSPRYLNLYGPTETNVCTYFELPPTTPAERTEPYPIGRSCWHVRCRVVDSEGHTVSRGVEGELVVSGDGVMQGYWNLPEQNLAAFLTEADGERWYRTGDLVVEDTAGVYIFHGRRDRMVKRRGYRIELAEIEAALACHPAAREVAVVACSEPGTPVQIKAYLGLATDQRPSLIELKQFCSDRLPQYMVPDTFHMVEALPRTSTDKIDYQALVARG